MNAKLLVSAAGALALAACGSPSDETAPDETLATDTATPTEAPFAAAAPTAQAFVDTAAASDAYEIEAGRLAQSMGTSQKVKDFGAMMVKDHTASTASLQAAAAQAAGVTVNPQLTALQQNNLDALRNAGDTFDTVYAQQQVAAHEEALRLLRDYAASGDAAPLKTFATDTVTVVEGHLVRARELP
jgi:putative membrane protein